MNTYRECRCIEVLAYISTLVLRISKENLVNNTPEYLGEGNSEFIEEFKVALQLLLQFVPKQLCAWRGLTVSEFSRNSTIFQAKKR